jgi:hypothetical protein
MSLCSMKEQYIYAQNQRMHHIPFMAQLQHYLQEQIIQYQGEIQSLDAPMESLSLENARLNSDGVHSLILHTTKRSRYKHQ